VRLNRTSRLDASQVSDRRGSGLSRIPGGRIGAAGGGAGQAQMGPFYFPGDRTVHIDLSFWNDPKTQFGDDWIQTHLGSGRADPTTYTHGTAAQRQQWFRTGYRTGDPTRCDTFGAASLG
jgi:predicted metalloprotease